MLSHVWLLETPWTAAYQAPPSTPSKPPGTDEDFGWLCSSISWGHPISFFIHITNFILLNIPDTCNTMLNIYIAGDGKLCCSPRFPGPAPSSVANVATPLSSNPAHQFPSTPSPLASPRRLDSAPGKNFKAPDRRLSAYSPAGDFRSVPGTPFPGGGGGLQSAPSLGASARGGWFLLTLAYPLEACASCFTLAVLLAFIFIS